MDWAGDGTEGDIITGLTLDPFKNPFQTELEEKYSESVLPSTGSLSDLQPGQYEEAKRDLDILYVRGALRQTLQNQRAAAELLGLTYDQFRGLYRKYKDFLI